MLDDEFEAHRRQLEGLAYRMCGVLADAQDVVQETHLRWCNAERASIHNPKSWLVTVCTRIAVDVMKSARARREQYVGVWLPEPYVDQADDPGLRAEIDDSVSVALMVAMEALTPSERAAFLLHDVFGYRFCEVAEILERSDAACRKLASRARKAVRRERPHPASRPEQYRRLLQAFFQAAHAGDFEGLEALLLESVQLHADGGGKVPTAAGPLHGPSAVAAFFARIWRENVPTEESVQIDALWFNGAPGVSIRQDERLIAALAIAVEGDAIARIFAVRNPDKLRLLSRASRPFPDARVRQ